MAPDCIGAGRREERGLRCQISTHKWGYVLVVLACYLSLISVSRFDTRTLRTQRQQQYVRENRWARSVVCLLFAVVLWVFSLWQGAFNQRKLIEPLRTADTLRCARNDSHVRTAVGVDFVSFTCQIWTYCLWLLYLHISNKMYLC